MKLNLSVGPVMMNKEIRKIGSDQIPYFRTEEFSSLMMENEQMLLKCLNAPEASRVIFLTASGTAAMEATVINLFSDVDKLLVVNGGSFGKRFKEIVDIHGIQSEEIILSPYQPLKIEHLERYNSEGFTGLLINAHETSTGVLYDMDMVGEFCKRNNILLVVDAISSFLADSYDMSAYGACATILSSQKAIALPPGMSFVAFDTKAQERLLKNRVKSLYFNFLNYLKEGERGQTPYTPAVSTLIQLNKQLKMIIEKGLDNIIKEVSYIAEDFRKGIKLLPLEIESENLSNALTPIKPIGNMGATQIVKILKDEYDIFVIPSGGELQECLFRVGHIGDLTLDDNKRLLTAFNELNAKGIL